MEKLVNQLPALKGTEKQVSWAVTIRQKMLDDAQESLKVWQERYARYVEKNGEEGKNTMYFKNGVEKMEKFIKYISSQTKADFFIDNRYHRAEIFADRLAEKGVLA